MGSDMNIFGYMGKGDLIYFSGPIRIEQDFNGLFTVNQILTNHTYAALMKQNNWVFESWKCLTFKILAHLFINMSVIMKWFEAKFQGLKLNMYYKVFLSSVAML